VVMFGVSGAARRTLLNLIGALDVPSAGPSSSTATACSSMTERARTRFAQQGRLRVPVLQPPPSLSTTMVPAEGTSRAPIRFRSVVLPHPDTPNMTTNSSLAMRRSTSRRTCATISPSGSFLRPLPSLRELFWRGDLPRHYPPGAVEVICTRYPTSSIRCTNGFLNGRARTPARGA